MEAFEAPPLPPPPPKVQLHTSLRSSARIVHSHPYKFMGFGAMDVTKPYKFIGFGAMDVTKPYKFIGFGAMDGVSPQAFDNEQSRPAQWFGRPYASVKGGVWATEPPSIYNAQSVGRGLIGF